MPPPVEASLLRTGPELVGSPLTAMDMPLALSPHSLPQQSGDSSFTSVSQNGQTLGSLRQNGSEITQTAGSLNSVHPCPWKAFVKWARLTSVRGRSPAQSSRSAQVTPSARATERSIPAVCFWGWLAHSPLSGFSRQELHKHSPSFSFTKAPLPVKMHSYREALSSALSPGDV